MANWTGNVNRGGLRAKGLGLRNRLRFLSLSQNPRPSAHPKAGEGNRTLTTSLEGWSSTIELRPRAADENLKFQKPNSKEAQNLNRSTKSKTIPIQAAVWALRFPWNLFFGIWNFRLRIGGSRIRTCEGISHQIYSLALLAAQESHRRCIAPARRNSKLAVGFEPTTSGLQNRNSAVELR
jgi:hypothetical protein